MRETAIFIVVSCFFFFDMRIFYKKPDVYTKVYGETYYCNHPKYNRCTLYLIKDKGLAVIQQHYDKETKHTWWDEVDPWLANDLYLSRNFMTAFNELSGQCDDKGIYPTIEVRKLMYRLRMHPMKKEDWES